MPTEEKHPHTSPSREQHAIEVVKEWPTEITKAPQPLPSTSKKTSPTK